MGKHTAKGPMSQDAALGELRAKLGTPSEWPGLRGAVLFLHAQPRDGRHVDTKYNAPYIARNARAMKDHYLTRGF